MHYQSVDRQMLLVPVAVLVIACMICTTDTARALAGLAWVLIVAGGMGWVTSLDMEKPWLLRLGATVLVAGSIWFLVWYYTGGKLLIHPIFDARGVFESIQQTLEAPTPGS